MMAGKGVSKNDGNEGMARVDCGMRTGWLRLNLVPGVRIEGGSLRTNIFAGCSASNCHCVSLLRSEQLAICSNTGDER